ncbi:glycerol kinase [Candidatus Nanopelagicales bacterium]|jgi:glycerol kinase|nr:glycerol kinase [Candidatus Nanopelagicales bacterium]
MAARRFDQPDPLILSIDAGTTGVTALLVDDSAQVVASGYREFTQHFPADDQVEHELGDIWAATVAATEEALAQVDRERVVALGITNQRETWCLWDRETMGSPRRAIVWQDRRTAGICDDLRELGHEPIIAEKTGLRLDPYFSGTKAMWIRVNEPHHWAHVMEGRVAMGTVDSYLIARMTRGLEHITDATNASRTLLFDIHEGAWSPQLCEIFGVPIESLPTVVPSYGPVATTDPAVFCGLEVPISGIAGDQQAALAGQAGFSAGAAKCTYGTGSFLLVHTGETPTLSSNGLLTTVALQHPDGRLDYALEGAIFVTGSAVQWLRDGLRIIDSAPAIEDLARSVPDSGGVVFVPALTGLGAPDWDPHARGLIIGITRGTTDAHIARATVDAIAFEVRDVVTLMADEGGVHLTSLAIDGGAAANDLLCQIQADQLQMPVDRSAQLQTTGLGAAFLAGLGVGVWASVDELRDTRQSSGIFEPETTAEIDIDDSYARWRRAVERSKGWSVEAR